MSFVSSRQRKKVMSLLNRGGRATLFKRHTRYGSLYAGISRRYGPYGVLYRREGNGVSTKFSIGSRGLELGINKRIAPRLNVGLGVSSLKGPYVESKFRKRKIRIG